ncbi:hypothetical protein [Escherichia phage P817]|nr:hypothetical protein [Escherichia phage P817]
MIILCIVLYILGAVPVYAIADEVRNSENKQSDLFIIAAAWPLVIAYGVVRKAYRALKEQ